MKQHYVITASGGQYDDAWERAEFITDDLDKGNAYCEKMNALAEAVRSANVQVGNWEKHYLIDHPQVNVLPYDLMPIPKWQSTDKVTVEMRNERERIQNINEATRQAAYKPVGDYNQRMYDDRRAYVSTLPEDVQRGMENSYYDTSWDVEPIAWLE